MRSLIVAPRTNLDIDNEMQRLFNSLHPTKVLLGVQASLLNVLDALANYQYDLVVFLTHGSMAGIQLADGLASASELSQLLRGARVRCIFLNTCESIGVAIRLHDEVKSAAVIATVGEVENDVATLTGALFAQHVATGASWREAYELSKPGDNKTYVYINDQMVGDDTLSLIEEIRTSGQRLQEALHTELIGVKVRLTALEQRGRPGWGRRVAWTVGFMLIAYVVHPLAYAEVRAFFEISLREAALLSVLLTALSGVLMIRALEDS